MKSVQFNFIHFNKLAAVALMCGCIYSAVWISGDILPSTSQRNSPSFSGPQGNSGPTGPPGPPGPTGIISRLLEATYNALIRVDSGTLKSFLTLLKEKAVEFNKHVYVEQLHIRDEAVNAVARFRVPAKSAHKFIDFVSGLRPGVVVEYVDIEKRDRTDEFRDLEAEILALKTSRDRLIVAGTRDGVDVVALEREIRQVDMELQRHDMRLKELQKRVDMTSVTIQIRERLESKWISEALTRWSTLSSTVFAKIIDVMVVLMAILPFAVLSVFTVAKMLEYVTPADVETEIEVDE